MEQICRTQQFPYIAYIFKLADYAGVSAGGNLYMQEPIYVD